MLENLPEEFYLKFLTYCKSELRSSAEHCKFAGILKGYNLNRQDSEFIKHLISISVIKEEKHLIEIYTENELKDFTIDDCYELGIEGSFEGKYYMLNNEIYTEIYKLTRFYIHERAFRHFSYDKDSIIAELSALFTENEKVNLLKEKIKFLWKFFKGEELSFFLLYMGKSDNQENLVSWEDEACEYLTIETDFKELYLTQCDIKSNFKSLYYDFFKNWVNSYRVSKLLDYCLTKIEYYEKCSTQKNTELNTSFKNEVLNEIFKEDGLDMFTHIKNNSSSKKNIAFYSYLYFFLQDRRKLQITSNDSVAYKNFILKNGFLPKFSRIIKTQDHSVAKMQAENEFNRILQSYSVKTE